MLSLGILNDSPTIFNKNLLNIKINVFKFLNNILYRKESLFPPLSRGYFAGLTSRNAVPCAADDLELFSSNVFDFTYEFGTSNYQPSGMNDQGFQSFGYPLGESKRKQPQAQPLDENFDFYSSSEGFVSPEEDESWKSGAKKRKFDNESTSSGSSSSELGNIRYHLDMDPLSYGSTSAYDVDRLFNDLIQDLPKSQPFHNPQLQTQIQTQVQPQAMPLQAPIHSLQTRHSYSPDQAFLPNQTHTINFSKESSSTDEAAGKHTHELNGETDDLLKYQCSHCGAKFKVKGYLTRHVKKHNTSKAFHCPFYKDYADGGKRSKCHPTGGFSRRDTYKTHLKALHFIYPPGTKSNERSSVSGRCAGCFQCFENNMQWLETHIENGGCRGAIEESNAES